MGYGIPGRRYGWISREGEFIDTGYHGHDDYCRDIGVPIEEVEKQMVRVSSTITLGGFDQEITDAQLRKLLEMLDATEIGESALKAACNVYDWKL